MFSRRIDGQADVAQGSIEVVGMLVQMMVRCRWIDSPVMEDVVDDIVGDAGRKAIE